MPNVLMRMGNIFEGAADLTVLPCSAKGTISSSTARWKDTFGLSTPTELGLTVQLGSVSPIYHFPASKNITKHYCYAASVLNDYSSADVIESIGFQLGTLTSDRADIRVVEAPLLGTGAGGLPSEVAGPALAKGFASISTSEATLYIFVYDRERFEKLERALTDPTVSQRVWNAVSIRPGIFGLSLDLKKLFGRRDEA